MEPLPNIDNIKGSTTSGLMHSDGYGGGIANMEFQTLTGLPLSNFSASVLILYSEVAPKMLIFPSISDSFQNKNRYVMHPSGSSNYNRYNVYKKLGFEHLIFLSDSKEKFKNITKTGVSMGDDSLYNNVLNKINSKQSQFFSVITMQNHAPWSVAVPTEMTASGQGFNEDENWKLTEYSRLLTRTDQATQEFLDSLSKIDKKITVVFYGDHLPGLYPDSAFIEDSSIKYQTDYFIWSNWQNKKLSYPLVNSNDFIAELFAHTDSKVSPYYALLTEVLDKVTNSNDRSSKEQESVKHDLKLLQYDITVGKGYIKKDKNFFKIQNSQ